MPTTLTHYDFLTVLGLTDTYDALGRVNQSQTVTGGGETYTYGFGYNARGLRTSRSASRGVAWSSLGYDTQNRLTSAELSNGTNYSYSYDGRGNRLTGGGAVTYTVNGLDQVTGRTAGQRGYGVSGTVAVGSQVKVYHPLAPNGEMLGVNPTTGAYSATWLAPADWNGGGVTQVEVLVRGTLPGGASGGKDAVAEQKLWMVVPAILETLGYDGAGRLIDDSMWTYTWDGRGYLTGMTRKAGTSADSTVTGETLGFGYDGDGRRTSKVRTLTYTSGSPRVESSRMLWDGWLPVMEERTVNGAGLTRRWYVWGRDVSGGLDGAGGIGGLVAIQEEGGRTLYPVEDGLGNITAVVNAANGATVARYDYGPYGEVAGESGEKDACPFRWQSKYYDGETGLNYFGYRYYSAKLGRWLSRDPLGEAGGFNVYAYCGNDPVNKWDYLGMAPQLHWTGNHNDSAFIDANGMPRMNYWDWAGGSGVMQGWNAMFGGVATLTVQSPSPDELSRFFRKDGAGWRVATKSEYRDGASAQFNQVEFPQAMRNARETTDMVMQGSVVIYAAPAAAGMLLAGEITTLGGGFLFITETTAAVTGTTNVIAGTRYANTPLGLAGQASGASPGTVFFLDLVNGFGAGAANGRGPQLSEPQMFREPLWQTLGYSNQRVFQMGSVNIGPRPRMLIAPKTPVLTVDRIQQVAQQGYDYAVQNPRVAGLNRMGLGKDAEIQATRWARRWAEHNGVDIARMQFVRPFIRKDLRSFP